MLLKFNSVFLFRGQGSNQDEQILSESLGNQTNGPPMFRFLSFAGKVQPMKELHERFLDLHIRGAYVRSCNGL